MTAVGAGTVASAGRARILDPVARVTAAAMRAAGKLLRFFLGDQGIIYFLILLFNNPSLNTMN